MSGLFSTLNVGTRGMSVQQKSIDVTSHNIANANTPGYSRQRATIETTRPFGMPSLNNTKEPGQLGTGAQIAAISRYRDAFLDYQTRVESSTKGQYDTRSSLLGEVEAIFNEPSDSGLSSLIGKFFDSWQQLSKQPQSSNTRTIVAQQSAAMANDMNSVYNKLINLKTDVQMKTDNTVVEINSKLDQIALLNQQIKGVTIAGNRANDLMDKRDLLLDELSSQFNLKISPKQFDGIDVSPVNTTPFPDTFTSFNMINSEIDGTEKRLSYVSEIKRTSATTADVTYYKLGDMTSDTNQETISITVDDDMFKELEETRVIWTDSSGVAVDSNGDATTSEVALFKPQNGELKGYASVQHDIDNYVEQLNKLAKAMAFSVNAVHSGQEDATNDGLLFFVNKDDATQAGEANITAGNISMNQDILDDVMKIKTRTNDWKYDAAADNTEDGEKDGARALAIAQLRDSLIRIQDMGTTITSRIDLFTKPEGNTLSPPDFMTVSKNTNGMKIDNYYKDTIDKLGIQSQQAQRMVTNQEALLGSLEESRASLSGVSLDEEMSNLIQFQHAYQANAKIISTVDELLDLIVNGLKR